MANMAEGLGGSLESFYFAFGDTDAYVVGPPGQPGPAAASIAVNAAGAATSEVVVLLTPEEIDAAAKLLGRLSAAWILIGGLRRGARSLRS